MREPAGLYPYYLPTVAVVKINDETERACCTLWFLWYDFFTVKRKGLKMERSYEPEEIEVALETIRQMQLRFARLDNKPLGFTSSERVEYDLLGGMFCDLDRIVEAARNC